VEKKAPSPFRLTATDGAGFHELKVEGELDLAVADRLKDGISQGDGRPVLVDLSDCDFLDSTGIAVVLLARREGAAIALHSPSDQVRRILSTLGLEDGKLVFAVREDAMSALSRNRQD
jgi:anti-anti-sigma factor